MRLLGALPKPSLALPRLASPRRARPRHERSLLKTTSQQQRLLVKIHTARSVH